MLCASQCQGRISNTMYRNPCWDPSKRDCLFNSLFRVIKKKVHISVPLWRLIILFTKYISKYRLMLPQSSVGQMDREIQTRPLAERQSQLLKYLLSRVCTTSNGSWCMGIKGEMSGKVCVTFTWDMYIYIYIYIYELFIAFVCFVVCSLL